MDQGESAWLAKLGGKFVVFDGPDGSGKTTQFNRFAAFARDQSQGLLKVCEVREPGGTGIGEHIRTVLLDPANDDMDIRCEMLLYMASRAQLVAQRIGPALGRGELVLADRFISSTLAYQGAAGGLAVEDINAIGKVALSGCWPDLVVVFDADEKTAAGRMSPLLDRMERKGSDFHRTVRQGYLRQARDNPGKYLVIDTTADADTVFKELLRRLREWAMKKEPTKEGTRRGR